MLLLKLFIYLFTSSPNWSAYISWKNELREFDKRSGFFSLGDHFINSHNLSVDSVWMLLGENLSWSLLALKGLMEITTRSASVILLMFHEGSHMLLVFACYSMFNCVKAFWRFGVLGQFYWAFILPWCFTIVGTQYTVFPPPPPPPPFLFSLTCSVWWVPAFWGGSWLGCQELPAIRVVSFPSL